MQTLPAGSRAGTVRPLFLRDHRAGRAPVAGAQKYTGEYTTLEGRGKFPKS